MSQLLKLPTDAGFTTVILRKEASINTHSVNTPLIYIIKTIFIVKRFV
jgi:hypothetical protein